MITMSPALKRNAAFQKAAELLKKRIQSVSSDYSFVDNGYSVVDQGVTNSMVTIYKKVPKSFLFFKWLKKKKIGFILPYSATDGVYIYMYFSNKNEGEQLNKLLPDIEIYLT